MKKQTKLILGLGTFAMCAAAAISVTIGLHQKEAFSSVSAEYTVYKYNNLNFDGRIDAAASGKNFKGVDGHHFEITACPGTTDWHVTLFNYDGDWSLTVGKQYKLEFEYKIDSAAADTFKLISSCRFQKDGPDKPDKPDALDIYGEYVVDRVDYGKYLKSEHTFTANVENPEIDIHLGLNKGAFNVFIRRVEVTLVETSEVVSSTYLESPNDFQNRWNNAHDNRALCDASDDSVKALLKLYSELVPWVRGDVNAKTALYPYGDDPASTLGEQIAYFATRVQVSFQ